MLPGDTGYQDWVSSETRFAKHIPLRNLLLCEEDGMAPGKLAFVHEDPNCLVFLAPAICRDADVSRIAASLFNYAIKEAAARGVSRLTSMIDSVNHAADQLMETLLASGFVIEEEKLLYTRSLTDALPESDSMQLKYLPFEDGSDADLKKALELFRVTHHRTGDLEEFRRASRKSGRCWRLVYEEKCFVGLSLLHFRDTDASLDLISLLPEARGRGLGNSMFVSALNYAVRQGANRYLGSTGEDNLAMQRLFERNGCQLLAQRRVFTFDLANAGAC